MLKKLFILGLLIIGFSSCVVKIGGGDSAVNDAQIASTKIEVSPPVSISSKATQSVHINISSIYGTEYKLEKMELSYQDKVLELDIKDLKKTIKLEIDTEGKTGVFSVPLTLTQYFAKGSELKKIVKETSVFFIAGVETDTSISCKPYICDISLTSLRNGELLPNALITLNSPSSLTPQLNTNNSICSPALDLTLTEFGSLDNIFPESSTLEILLSTLMSMEKNNSTPSNEELSGFCDNPLLAKLSNSLLKTNNERTISFLTNADAKAHIRFKTGMLKLYSNESTGEDCDEPRDYMSSIPSLISGNVHSGICKRKEKHLEFVTPSSKGREKKQLTYHSVVDPTRLKLISSESMLSVPSYCEGGVCSFVENYDKNIVVNAILMDESENNIATDFSIEDIYVRFFYMGPRQNPTRLSNDVPTQIGPVTITPLFLKKGVLSLEIKSSSKALITIDRIDIKTKGIKKTISSDKISFAVNFTNATVKHLACTGDVNDESKENDVPMCMPKLSRVVGKKGDNEQICAKVLDDTNTPVASEPVSWSFLCENPNTCGKGQVFATTTVSNSNGIACVDISDFKAPIRASSACDYAYENCNDKDSFSDFDFKASLGDSSVMFNLVTLADVPVGTLSRYAYVNGIKKDGFDNLKVNDVVTGYLVNYKDLSDPSIGKFNLFSVDQYQNIIEPSNDLEDLLNELKDNYNISIIDLSKDAVISTDIDIDTRQVAYTLNDLFIDIKNRGIKGVVLDNNSKSEPIASIDLKQAYSFEPTIIKKIIKGGTLDDNLHLIRLTDTHLEFLVSTCIDANSSLLGNIDFDKIINSIDDGLKSLTVKKPARSTRRCYDTFYSYDWDRNSGAKSVSFNAGIQTSQGVKSSMMVQVNPSTLPPLKAKLEINPVYYDFGNQDPVQISSKTFVIKNITPDTQTAQLSVDFYQGPKAPVPALELKDDKCTGVKLSYNQTCEITVSTLKGSDLGEKVFMLNVKDSTDSSIFVSTGIKVTYVVPKHKLIISPSGDFGTLVIEESKTIIFTIKNIGNVVEKGLISTLEGIPFSLISNNCTDLNVGETCQVTITAASRQFKGFNGKMSIKGDNITIDHTLGVVFIPKYTVTPIDSDFGAKTIDYDASCNLLGQNIGSPKFPDYVLHYRDVTITNNTEESVGLIISYPLGSVNYFHNNSKSCWATLAAESSCTISWVPALTAKYKSADGEKHVFTSGDHSSGFTISFQKNGKELGNKNITTNGKFFISSTCKATNDPEEL